MDKRGLLLEDPYTARFQLVVKPINFLHLIRGDIVQMQSIKLILGKPVIAPVVNRPGAEDGDTASRCWSMHHSQRCQNR